MALVDCRIRMFKYTTSDIACSINESVFEGTKFNDNDNGNGNDKIKNTLRAKDRVKKPANSEQ